LARRIARPVRRVVDAAGHLAQERDPAPVPIEGAYEIARLAQAFNDLAAQLAGARAAAKQFLLSVSHELKTRLTAIRGYAERVLASPGTLVVEDSGQGLRQEELEHAFERFYLYSRYASDRTVGTGLGLSIVQELTRGMGGSVEVESTPGRGTRFTVRLPNP